MRGIRRPGRTRTEGHLLPSVTGPGCADSQPLRRDLEDGGELEASLDAEFGDAAFVSGDLGAGVPAAGGQVGQPPATSDADQPGGATGLNQPAANVVPDAAEALEQARYRSGFARAELFRAFLHARTGAPGQASASARWAIAEPVAAEFYPPRSQRSDLHILTLRAP